MVTDREPGRRSVSPDSSGRDSPIPRQWRTHLAETDPAARDKAYRRYAVAVEKALSLFETALEEWADYISFLNRLLKALQAKPASNTVIPSKVVLAKRLSQCLNPSLPSGVHQKALEVYEYVFSVIGKAGLSRDLPLYFPGLSPTLSFAALSVRSPFLDILQEHFTTLDPRSLRPAMKSIILALLPGLEDETAEDFDRTLKLLARFKEVIRQPDSELLTDVHSLADDFFWQCFFLASITSPSRRAGALSYLSRFLPSLGHGTTPSDSQGSSANNGTSDRLAQGLAAVVTSPEPGLLIRCIASGLTDEQLLIQRGFLDLLVTHLPLDSQVLQEKVKSADLELLMKAATGVVTRREMSLNRRLWSWLLGPDPTAHEVDQVNESSGAHDQHSTSAAKTNYFEDYGLQSLTKAILDMVRDPNPRNVAERARPYRVCLSLMDRWEIGGMIVPEVFLPIIQSVQQFQQRTSAKDDFQEVLRSASVFFDGIESGLIFGELLSLLAQAIGPGGASVDDRDDKLALVDFVLKNFNVREEEMVTIHVPLCCIAVLAMLDDANQRREASKTTDNWSASLTERVLGLAISLLELIPERAFVRKSTKSNIAKPEESARAAAPISNSDILQKIRRFYINEQGNLDSGPLPLAVSSCSELILQKAVHFVSQDDTLDAGRNCSLAARVRILLLSLVKVPTSCSLDVRKLVSHLQERLDSSSRLPFPDFASVVQLTVQLCTFDRMAVADLEDMIPSLTRHAWSYLVATDPKYHVETVRCLWQLQTTLTVRSRNIEAALATIVANLTSEGSGKELCRAEVCRTFGILWLHTLQDNPSDRRALKTPMAEYRAFPRLAGMDNYEVMLAQPLFLLLDALLDERTRLHLSVKSWLNSIIGIDRLFLLLIIRLYNIPYLRIVVNLENGESGSVLEPNVPPSVKVAEDDDLDLCLYYLRTLYHILQYSGQVSWSVLMSQHLIFGHGLVSIGASSGDDGASVTMQDFLIRICLRCITGDPLPDLGNNDLEDRNSDLQRFALMIVHQFLLSRNAAALTQHGFDRILVERLARSIDGPDPFVQVQLLDVVYATLRLPEAEPVELPTSPLQEIRRLSLEPKRVSRASLSIAERQPTNKIPDPQLLKCIQAGLSSPSSRLVLDSWIAFLTHCLPFYAGAVFQILIPLVETLCQQIGSTFTRLHGTFRSSGSEETDQSTTSDSILIYLLNGLEQVLGRAHDQLLTEESQTQLMKTPDQPQSLFGSMVSGVFQSENPHVRSATANDRITVHIAFQDAVRICYKIWSWGQGDESSKQDVTSSVSFNYTSLRMRNRARRLLEHLFTAETLECLETLIDIWLNSSPASNAQLVFNFLSALDASRPKHTIPALFNALYSRTNPGVLELTRKSTMMVSLRDIDISSFLVEYVRSLDDDAMDEIWQDCITFLKDLLSNPFPHRHTLPSLLEFAALLGAKVDNTNFGDQKRMRRELGDLFLRLLTAIFTTRPISFADPSTATAQTEKGGKNDTGGNRAALNQADRANGVVAILAAVVPNLPKVLPEPDRVLQAASSISQHVVGPTLRSKMFPGTVTESTMRLLHELSRLHNNQKTWKKDVGDAFDDSRFFSMDVMLVKDDWMPLLRQWSQADKDKIAELVGRINAPSTAGIVFGVGATSARLEADRKTQLNLRRIATLILSATEDTFVTSIPVIFDKVQELLLATSSSSPSSATRADVYMVIRAMVLKMSAIHLAVLWPVVNSEMHAAISSVVAPDHSAASETYTNTGILQACKLLDLLICAAPDDFQLHEWLFVNDTIDAVYRSFSSSSIALVDELSEELGSTAASTLHTGDANGQLPTSSNSKSRRPLLGAGGIGDDVVVERKDELVAKILRPFFGQLSIYAFETTYALSTLDRDVCVQGVLKDIFDEKTIVKAL